MPERTFPVLRDEYVRLRRALIERAYGTANRQRNASVADEYHKVIYNLGHSGGAWEDTRFLGIRVLKNPFDLWAYQEILTEVRPDVLIETGTLEGGSAWYYAHLMDLLGHGRVITIDIVDRDDRPAHPRIKYISGSSIEPSVVAAVRREAGHASKVMVTLDSNHAADHVLQELQTYGPMVTTGSYCVVEDGNVNGHPVMPAHGPGPFEALTSFLRENRDFEVDRSREKYLVSFNPSGYLRRR